ncbi:protein ei24 like protein [Quercus suber]|uniref:Protein ei24 like protein n=1 Tax=Quercus suber TaxID=58331 RepID=A0AAW0KMM8_QUESU
MEAMKPLMKLCIAKLKQGTLLWLEGFKEACYLHRVVILCLSMIVLNSVVIPMLFWILPDQCSQISTQVPCSFGGILKLYSVLRLGLIQLFYLCIAKLKQGTLLWLEGFKEACYLHRVVILCLRSRKLLIRTGQCFLLNGFIFLGSIIVLNSVVIPMLFWILPDQCSQISTQVPCSFGGILKLYSFLRLGLIQLFYVLWFYPLYMYNDIAKFGFAAMGRSGSSVVEPSSPSETLTAQSTAHKERLAGLGGYNDIAKFGFAAMGRSGSSVVEPSSPSETLTAQSTAHKERLAGLGGVMVGIGEQVFATGFIPYVGKAINFLLLSWIYKWNFSEVALDKRLDYFESNWAFFAGSPCVLAIFFVSPLVSYGIMAVLFPLFVLAATCSGAEQDISFPRRKWRGVGLGRLPIFYAADRYNNVLTPNLLGVSVI